jgi:hypothetical protein
VGGVVVVALWPAELKPQAEYLYANGRGVAMIEIAGHRGWNVWPAPQLAFFTSPATQRLYIAPNIDPAAYARRWEGADTRRIGQYSAEDVRLKLWPWLKNVGYAEDADEDALERFLGILGRRPAHFRPALRLHRRWTAAEVDELHRRGLATAIRDDVSAVLRAAGDPPLPSG